MVKILNSQHSRYYMFLNQTKPKIVIMTNIEMSKAVSCQRYIFLSFPPFF